MVAKSPLTQRKLMVAPPLSPTLLRDTIKKVDLCMERLQELQYTVTGGNKVVGGVKLSPRSTKAYLKTSLRCKQESMMRIRNSGTKRSPTGKHPAGLTGEWRRMSLKAMLVGETVSEILQTSQFTKQIMSNSNIDDPKTPLPRKQRTNQENTPIETRRKREKQHKFRVIQSESITPSMKRARSRIIDDPKTPLPRKQRTNQENTPIETRRKREKQHKFRVIQSESITPSMKRARSRINFKVSPPKRPEIENRNVGFTSTSYYMANKVSPKHKPWVRKTVLFPNPLFHSSPNSQTQNFCKTKSLMIPKKRDIPHKFIVKSPVKIRSPQKGLGSVSPVSKHKVVSCRKSPPKQQFSTAAKLRRSLSPSRIASRFVSPLKGRRNSMASSLLMMPMRFSASSRMSTDKGK